MLRERWFALGAAIMFVLGAALLAGLWPSNFGPASQPVFLVSAATFAIGLLFWAAAREARRYRLEYFRAVEEGRSLPEGGPPR